MKKGTIKKIILLLLSVVLVFAISFGSYVLYRFNCNKLDDDGLIFYEDIYTKENVTLNVSDDGKFRVLKINDTHFFNGTCENDVKTLESIEKVLDSTPCDLIIVNGDLVEGFNLSPEYDKLQAISNFARLIESYNIPWTFAPGNNDCEIDGDNEDVVTYLMGYSHFICGNSKDIDGSMQFFIDLNYQDKLVHSIAVMDSNSRKIRAIGSYDYIKQSQIDWLMNGVSARNVKTSVFFHMPTPQFKAAYENGEAYEDYRMFDNNNYADIGENELFDNAIDGNENIALLSCSHQHGNNMCSFYNDRYYQLSSVSGYSAGRPSEIIPSCTLTSIDVNAKDTQSMYSFEQIYFE